MKEGFYSLEFECENIEATTKRNALSGEVAMVLKCFHVELKDIMENLNFEDVMNYYGVSAVCEWCEANR